MSYPAKCPEKQAARARGFAAGEDHRHLIWLRFVVRQKGYATAEDGGLQKEAHQVRRLGRSRPEDPFLCPGEGPVRLCVMNQAAVLRKRSAGAMPLSEPPFWIW